MLFSVCMLSLYLPACVMASRWQSDDSDLSITEIWIMGLKTERSIVLRRQKNISIDKYINKEAQLKVIHIKR